MLRALIVDDEKLVRKGILNLVEWEKYGMQVVGEAENGGAALQFLSENEVNVLFTDLSMPGISGIEYLEQVRSKFPNINIIVLTMHHDFNTLQQAMRLGVVDYITKTQMEKENLDFLMNNVVKQIKLHNIYVTSNVNQECGENSCIIAYGRGAIIDNLIKNTLSNMCFKKYDESIWISEAADIWPPNIDLEQAILIKLDGVKNKTFNDILADFRQTFLVDLFYCYEEGKHFYQFTYDKNDATTVVSKEVLLDDLKELSWVFDEKIYTEYLKKLISLRMLNKEISMYCYQFYVQWVNLINCSLESYFDDVSKFEWWIDWKNWLDENRLLLNHKLSASKDDKINKIAIQKAISYIETHFQSEIALEDLLALTNMSKSHFCKQFKKATGSTCLTYTKEFRVERAKNFLLNTNQPIYWISWNVGYANEKYFRRVFYEITGKTPKDYRKSKKHELTD